MPPRYVVLLKAGGGRGGSLLRKMRTQSQTQCKTLMPDGGQVFVVSLLYK